MAETNKQRLDRVEKLEYWRGHIEKWTISTLPASTYCRQNKLSLCQFKYWQQRIGCDNPPLFVEVEAMKYTSYTESQPERTITIQTPKGYSISIQTSLFESDLASLLNLMGRQTC